MDQFQDIFLHLAQNPIKYIIDRFIRDYEDKEHKTAFYDTFLQLYFYTRKIGANRSLSELSKLFQDASTRINREELPLSIFSPLIESIKSESKEQFILKTVVQISLENKPEPTQTRPGNPLLLLKPSI